MAEGLRDHQESNESEVCDEVIDVPNHIPSLLDKLKCPSTSDLARKRKIKTNRPSGKKKDVKEQLPVNHAVQLPVWSTGCRAIL